MRGSSWEARERGAREGAGRLNNEARLMGPVGTRVCFDREGNVEQKDQILRSLRSKIVYSCLYSQDLEYRCLRQGRYLMNVPLKVVCAGRSQAKAFSLEDVSQREPICLFEPI